MTTAAKHTAQSLPEAHATMNRFEWFIGNWDIESRVRKSAESDDWLEETLYAEHTYELNHHIIFEHFFGPVGEQPYEAWSIRKYNSQADRWQQKWFDTSAPYVLNWSGTFNEAGEFIGYNERYLNAEFEIVGETATREIFYNIQADSFDWRYETTADGGKTWIITWTLKYTRRG